LWEVYFEITDFLYHDTEYLQLPIRDFLAAHLSVASYVPTLTGGNTNAAAILIAEKPVESAQNLNRAHSKLPSRRFDSIEARLPILHSAPTLSESSQFSSQELGYANDSKEVGRAGLIVSVVLPVKLEKRQALLGCAEISSKTLTQSFSRPDRPTFSHR
jgi:hypothetical protein